MSQRSVTKLKFQGPHLSIESFNSIDIPQFVILTGENGSGKSHLLDAIAKGKVVIEGIQKPEIAIFNYETFKLDDESSFNAHQVTSEVESAWDYFTKNVQPHTRQWSNLLPQEFRKPSLEPDELLRPLDDSTAAAYRSKISEWMGQQNRVNDVTAQSIFSLSLRLPFSLEHLNKEMFVRLYKHIDLKARFLPVQLGRAFWNYYIRRQRNRLNKVTNEQDNASLPVIDDTDFRRLYGRPPWEIVNEILGSFDSLRFEVNTPEGLDAFGSFTLKLRHIDKPNLEVAFSHLSSGERILMALVASVYKSSSDRRFPDILLLDEVDASLHPSMMRNMLDVIDRVFLAERTTVILVTHSPTTIALAPEESIFLMRRSGADRIEKMPKAQALRILTQGFATIQEGLRLFDQVALSKLTIITEGHNAVLIEKALQLNGINDVEVLKGVEGRSGSDQLKTIFQFFTRTVHETKVLFVWDCDMSSNYSAANNTFPFVIPVNENNKIAKRGIENAFSENLRNH